MTRRIARTVGGTATGLRRARALGGLAAAGLLVLAACLGPDPALPGGALLRHNWWNYYARGAARLRQDKVAEAADDFRRSLGDLSGAKFGNARDRWRARTYGLHFVEGYFPHRELGICLYELGDLPQAVHHLETSLRQEPSGRAKHYLNLVRQRLLSARPSAAPRLALDSPAGGWLTRERAVTLCGKAEGEGYIRRLSVGGRAEFVELALPELQFTRRLPLLPGTNRFEVAAEDLLGRRVLRDVFCVADWQPPGFVLRCVVPKGNGWQVEGVCRDRFGLASVFVGGSPLFLGDPAEEVAETAVSFRVPAGGAELVATDQAGNELVCRLDAGSLAATVRGTTGERSLPDSALPLVASLEGPGRLPDPAFSGRMSAFWRGLPPGLGEYRLAAVDPEAPVAAPPPATGGGDRLRPSLSLRGCPPVSRVFGEEFFIDGTVADRGGLAGVTISGENLLAEADVGAPRAYFARRLPLDPGTNVFEVVATDRQGNRTARVLTVVRFQPEHLTTPCRLSVGVPPLTPETAGTLVRSVKRTLEMELTREPVRFRLLERDEGWDFILREQGLSLSDLADPATALRIGRMVPAEMLLMGRIILEAAGVTLYVKAVETGDGEVLFSGDVYSPDSDRGLPGAVEGLVLKVIQGFPLVRGRILRREGARVTLDVGREDGVQAHSRFLVLESPDTDRGETAGRIFREGETLVQLRVETVRARTCTARILPSGAQAGIKEGCHVYTR